MELCMKKEMLVMLIVILTCLGSYLILFTNNICPTACERARDTTIFQTIWNQKFWSIAQEDSPVWTDLKNRVNQLDVDKYVTFGDVINDGRGLGNLMFDFVAVLYVAMMSDRIPVLRPAPFANALDQTFNLSEFVRFGNLCPCYHFVEGRGMSYDERVEQLGKIPTESASARTITLSGFFQSWMYTRLNTEEIRKYFRFRTEIRQFALKYLKNIAPSQWKRRGFVQIAIHNRRGDFLNPNQVHYGHTVADGSYFQRAMNYFIKRCGRVQFLVFSQDEAYAKANIIFNPSSLVNVTASWSPDRVNVTYVKGNTPGQDMAIIAACDHTIISVGSFGWWGAWLGKGTAVYYGGYPKVPSELGNGFTLEHYYPPGWIAM